MKNDDEQNHDGDIRDLSGLDPDALKELTKKRITEEFEQRQAESKEASKKLPEPGEVDSKFVLQCLDRNEAGDGALYGALNHGKYAYNTTEQEWLSYTGHHWKKDLTNSALSAVENVANRYLQETYNITNLINEAVNNHDDQKIKSLGGLSEKIIKRVYRLRSQRGRQNCLAFAQAQQGNKLTVPGDRFDLNPLVIACENGVVDLRTGILRPGKPEDFILRAILHKWEGINCPSPVFESFLKSTFNDDMDLIAFLQRYLGYSISGLNIHRKFIVFYGRGQNGKSLLVELLQYVLGALASPIQSELLLDQGRSRSSAAPSPDILALKGLRIAFASETDEGRRFSSSRVKWLSGSDSLVGRSPHAKHETIFAPTHKLFLLTNNKPGASANDFALWERLFLINFKLAFVNRKPQADNEREADLYLLDKLKTEAAGVLAWLVRGFIKWQENGLDPPPAILDATLEYRREEDILQDYIEENCFRDPKAKVGASELYDSFSSWYDKNVSKKGISQRRFGRIMTAAGFEKIKSGTFSYLGLGLLAG